MPQHLIARDSKGQLCGAVPLYLKSHSYGEYVFDHTWARAYRSSLSDASAAGSSYYPKLQACVPFTPVTGLRLLVREKNPERLSAVRAVLGRGLVALADRLGETSPPPQAHSPRAHFHQPIPTSPLPSTHPHKPIFINPSPQAHFHQPIPTSPSPQAHPPQAHPHKPTSPHPHQPHPHKPIPTNPILTSACQA